MRPVDRLMSSAALLAALWAPATLAAQVTRTSPEDRTALPPVGGSSPDVGGQVGGSLLRLGIGLLVVVGLILGLWMVLKRVQRSRMPGFGGGAADLVDVVATAPLGPNRFLHLVRVGEELVLVGATDHAVTPVLRIGGDEAVALLGDALEPAAAAEAFAAAGARSGPDPRTRAAASAQTASLVERLRALTTRR